MWRRHSRKFFFSFLIILSVTGTGYGFGISKSKPLPVKWVKVTKGVIRQTIITTGVVQPEDGAQIKVGSRVSGKIEKLFVKVGDAVNPGDPVAVIEHHDLQVKVAEKKAEYEVMRETLRALLAQRPLEIARQKEKITEVKAQLDQSRITWRRYQELLPEKLIAREDVDLKHKEVLVFQSRLAAEKSQLEYMERKFGDDKRILKAKLDKSAAQVQLAKINLGYAFIKSPIGGTIAKISTPEGETVAAQLSSPTFVWIINLDKLWVSTYVDETDIGKVHKGQPVIFHVDAFPGMSLHGVVKEIYPKAETRDNMVTYDVIVDITDPPKKRRLLRPEMTAYTTIIVKEKRNAIQIPVQAVKIIKGKRVVFFKGKKGIEQREILAGWLDSGKIEIRKGLKPGQEVLIQGFNQGLLKQ